MSATHVPYWEKLKDPRWQKKRLEIMERDEFSCVDCDDDKSTLNVHHCYYKKGFEPWEYPDECYKTLCENCHNNRHDIRSDLDAVMSVLSLNDLFAILGYVKGLAFRFNDVPFSLSGHFEAFGALCSVANIPIAYVANLPDNYPMSSDDLAEAVKEVHAVLLPLESYIPTQAEKDAANG